MPKYLYIILLLLFASCNREADSFETLNKNSKNRDYFDLQIDTLVKQSYGLLRHTLRGDDLSQYRQNTLSKSLWEQELQGFLNLADKPSERDTQFQVTLDKTGIYEIESYAAKDTLKEFQNVTFTRVRGKVELISWKIQKKSLLMDRVMELSYQPLKGYRIKMYEDAAWSRPTSYEIFAEFIK
jgi:hypothetical protein